MLLPEPIGRPSGPMGLGGHGWGTTVHGCGEEHSHGEWCSEHGKHSLIFIFSIVSCTFFYFLFLTPDEAQCLPLLITLAVMLISNKNDMLKPDFIVFSLKKETLLPYFWLDETSWIPWCTFLIMIFKPLKRMPFDLCFIIVILFICLDHTDQLTTWWSW